MALTTLEVEENMLEHQKCSSGETWVRRTRRGHLTPVLFSWNALDVDTAVDKVIQSFIFHPQVLDCIKRSEGTGPRGASMYVKVMWKCHFSGTFPPIGRQLPPSKSLTQRCHDHDVTTTTTQYNETVTWWRYLCCTTVDYFSAFFECTVFCKWMKSMETGSLPPMETGQSTKYHTLTHSVTNLMVRT